MNTDTDIQKKKTVAFDIFLIIFIIMAVMNIALTFFVGKITPVNIDLKRQSLLEKTLLDEGIDKDYFAKINSLNNGFPNEERIISLVENINKSKSLFNSFSFNFDSDEPKSSLGLKFFPSTMKITGKSDQIISLLKSLTQSREMIEISSIEMGINDKGQTEALIKANIYINNKFN